MYLSTLSEWLAWIQQVHATRIELGLERVRAVAAKLELLLPRCPVITVGGTNGKGSTVAGLLSVYTAAGFSVGTFTSPYLLKYNEEICINGQPVSDQALCDAFSQIEAVRDDLPLTVFEYSTLAALLIFRQHPLDVIILEVGLGGRLDAVNIIAADVAIITSIGIDHTDWLGSTREAIGFEKAGIMRAHRPVVCGDRAPPASLLQQAARLGAPFYGVITQFDYVEKEERWQWQSDQMHYVDLPYNHLATINMASVLMAVTLLQKQLPVGLDAIRNGLRQVVLRGRIEVIAKPVIEIYDVGHNPDALQLLHHYLQNHPIQGQTFALFSMLKDKDIVGCMQVVSTHIDAWYIAPLQAERAAPRYLLQAAADQAALKAAYFFDDLADAYASLQVIAKAGDRIIIFGSFYTVASIFNMQPSVEKL